MLPQGAVFNPLFLTSGMLKLFQQYAAAPYLVVANKQDLAGALSPEEIRKALKVEKVLPCVAIDKASVENVLLELTEAIG